MEFKIYYKHGLHSTIVVEAKDEKEAINKGLAEYRRNYGCYNMVSDWPAEFVVDKAVPVQKA